MGGGGVQLNEMLHNFLKWKVLLIESNSNLTLNINFLRVKVIVLSTALLKDPKLFKMFVDAYPSTDCLKARPFLSISCMNSWKVSCNKHRRKHIYIYMLCKEFKGTHTVYFCSSLYIINQKPMIHTTDFHCIIKRVAHFFRVKFGNAFDYFVVSCSLARWRYYSI